MDAISAGYVAVCIYALWRQFKGEEKQEFILSEENLSTGISLCGIQGSGKTFKAIIDCKKLLARGFKFCWITTQGERQSKLIDFIPRDFIKDIELFAPYKHDSKGFNILKCYTSTENERRLRSQTIVILVSSITGGLVEVQRYCLRLASDAILEYQFKTSTTCTLHDVVMFIKREDFRTHILTTLNRKDWEEDWTRISDSTIEAVIRRLDDLLSYTTLKRALCYTKDDALDFREMFDKILVCDFLEDNIHGCGTLQAIALAQAVVTQFNILASTRTIDSPYYQITCDEFYRYAQGIEDIFKDFPDLHRQRRLGLCLIWQRATQMSLECLNVALSCANRYFMKMSPESDKKITDNETYKGYRGKFSNLKKREYYAFLNTEEGTLIEFGKTEDIGKSDPNNYSAVWNNCRSKLPDAEYKWWFEGKTSDDHTVDLSKYRS